MTGRKATALLLATLMIGSVVAIPALAAVQLTGSATDGSTNPGGTAQVSFTVTNEGDETPNAAVLALTSLPSGWSVDSTDGDGSYRSSSQEFLYFSAPGAGASVASTVTLSVPADAESGDYTVSADVKDADNNVVDTVNATVTVEQQFSLSSNGGAGKPGEQAVVTFTVENNGASTVNGSVLDITDHPSGWSIASTSGDGTFQSADKEVLYVTIDGGASAETSVLFNVPESATNGTYSVSADLLTQGSSNDSSNDLDVVASTTATVRVHKDPVERYDKDGDGTVDTSETLTAIRDWEAAGLSTAEVLQLISKWASG